MGALEDALRETFTERVALPPALDDAADQAIERAGRHRRRQAVLGALAIVVAVVLTGGGAMMFAGAGEVTGTEVAGTPSAEPRAVPVPVSPSGKPPMDVLIGDSIVSTGGTVVPLDQVLRAGLGSGLRRQPLSAYRSGGTWLVRVTDPTGGEALYRVWPNGSVAYLLKGQSIVVAMEEDRVSVSWLDGRRVFAAQLEGNGWVGQKSVDVPAGTRPLAFSFRAVLLHGRNGYELWFPRGGWRGALAAPAKVYGSTPGGAVLGLAAVEGTLRLAEYSADKLELVRTGAIIPTPDLTATGLVSPDGRWLLMVSHGSVGLYDLTRAFTEEELGPALSWTMDVTNAAWRDSGTFAVGGSDTVLLVRTDGSTAGEVRFTADRALTAAVIPP